MAETKRPKIGLALGSGSARGLAHIGVIKALEENNIPIDFIAGSSIGALIGGFYASGIDIKEIGEIALNTDWRNLFSMLFEPSFKSGVISGEKVTAFIKKHIDEKKFEDCKIPFAAVATDLKTGESVILDKSKMATAIRASISIPLIFKPVEIEGRILADGGLSAPVPVEIVRNMGADIVIAVNLDKHYFDENWSPGWYDIANDSLNILRHHLARADVLDADIVIDIDVGKTYWYQFTNGQDKILAGEKAMKELLPKLQEIIHQKNKKGIRKYLDFFR
ncbi:MAG TPA: patatin-like phospholipase family protein [Candidatus Paceibacterota bacterium]|nr:patatin-like phospholipase family protein [Candidatus Paceibacterota bacterium]